MFIILLGPPGSGKGTQSDVLIESLQAIHISTGSMLRQEINRKTELGLAVEKIMREGKLVSNELINQIIKTEISRLDLTKSNVILDGYPRNLTQAQYLEQVRGKTPITVIYLSLDEQEIKKRLLGRFSCPNCQKSYNVFFDKPIRENECDNCGKVDFVTRQDDNESTILNRLIEYRKETEPLIEYYKDKRLLIEVDSSKSKDEVSRQIIEFIKRS